MVAAVAVIVGLGDEEGSIAIRGFGLQVDSGVGDDWAVEVSSLFFTREIEI